MVNIQKENEFIEKNDDGIGNSVNRPFSQSEPPSSSGPKYVLDSNTFYDDEQKLNLFEQEHNFRASALTNGNRSTFRYYQRPVCLTL